MIVRIWRGETTPEKAHLFIAHERKYGMRLSAETPGNRGVYLLRRDKGDRVEYIHLTFWDDLEAVKRFAGEDYEKSLYQDEDKDILIELLPTAEHYEVVERA